MVSTQLAPAGKGCLIFLSPLINYAPPTAASAFYGTTGEVVAVGSVAAAAVLAMAGLVVFDGCRHNSLRLEKAI